MTLTDVQNCLLKYKKSIAFLVAFAIILCTAFINITKSYTAEVFIKYTGEDASKGLTENGKQLDPHEISDAIIVKRAIDDTGARDITFAKVRRGLEITPIVPTAEEEKHASWIENFSSYDENEEKREMPIYYSVKLTTDVGPEIARNLVRSLVEQYCIYYVENYASESDMIGIYDKSVMEYDYFETVEFLKKKITHNINYLENIASGDINYRSAKNGYSVMDLSSKFANLLDTRLSSVAQKILEQGISKDGDGLALTLKNKAEKQGAMSEQKKTDADTQLELMKVYAEKNKEYLWNMYEQEKSEGEQVRSETERDNSHASRKTTYDQMTLDYVSYMQESENLIIDKEQNEKNVDYFSGMGSKNDEIEAELSEIISEYNKIYKLAEEVIRDYNGYKSARYVCKVSGIVSGDNTPTVFYYTLSIVLALLCGCAIAFILELKRKNKI